MQKSGSSTKRLLDEMVERLPELVDPADSDDEDSIATEFFQDLSRSEADEKDVGTYLPTYSVIKNETFRAEYFRPKHPDLQFDGSSSIYLHTYRRILASRMNTSNSRKTSSKMGRHFRAACV